MKEQEPKLVSGTFVLVTFSGFAYFFALGMILPTLPLFVKDELHGGGFAIGIAAGAMAVTAALLRPWVGRTGDDAGRRKLVVGGALLVMLSFLAYSLAGSLWQLVAARLLTGAGEAMFFVGASTAIQDLAPDSRRAEAASYFSLAVWGGSGVGPAMAEAIGGDGHFDRVWFAAAGLCVVAAVLGWGTPPGQPAEPVEGKRRFFQPTAARPGAVLMLSIMGLAAFQTFLVLYADDIGTEAGPLFALYAGLMITMRLAGARMADRRGPRLVASAALVVQAIGLLVMTTSPTVPALYIGTALLAIGVAPIYPALLALAIDASPVAERSSAMATFSLFFDLSQGLGLPILGGIVALGGERSAFAAGAAFCAAAFMLGRVWIPRPDHPVPSVAVVQEFEA